MIHYPKETQFIYSWRKYQERVLNELEEHLEDDHLHIIAPPGSGKTVLGLEVAIRLNQPTLILAPTLAIRDQWIQRFCECFLKVNRKPDWISRDISSPRFLTVSTYQSLHSVYKRSIEKQNSLDTKSNFLVDKLKEQSVKTIVVDEAHHLKNSWWESLISVKNALNPTIVGLTATPPYDVSFQEWERYLALNGPVDTEITIPELIIEGNLCPHQDYVYLSKPDENESEKIFKHRQQILKIYNFLKSDQTLIKSLSNSKLFINPTSDLDWLYTNIESYLGLLVFLNQAGITITPQHFEITGYTEFKIPELDFHWMEVVLEFYLFKNPEKLENEHKDSLIKKLKVTGILERQKIDFRHSNTTSRQLVSSISKLSSIKAIVRAEYKQLSNSLRMVILCDFIRKDFLVSEAQNNLKLNKIGVIPVFELLRRNFDKRLKLGVLTGSSIIIPAIALEPLNQKLSAFEIDNINAKPLLFDSDYMDLEITESSKNHIIHIITNLFSEGYFHVIVGTKSLLGEGWDAPCINSLIIGSYVGSFVMSNQMRGRAIRTDKNNPNKTANIWHLACVNPMEENGGTDLEMLRRRFKSFVGLSNGKHLSIENGLERVGLNNGINGTSGLSSHNEQAITQAMNRDTLKSKWQKALKSGHVLIEEIKVPYDNTLGSYQQQKQLKYNGTIKYTLAMMSSAFIGFLIEGVGSFGRFLRDSPSGEEITWFLIIMGAIGAIVFGRMAFISARLFMKYRDIAKDIRGIAETLLLSLINESVIKTPIDMLNITAEVDANGTIYCHLEGGTTYEKSSFLKALGEIVNPINNPRYIIVRKSLFAKVFSQKDYHALPELLGKNKKSASFFSSKWQRLVGKCELLYTRTIEGRKLILKSRIESLSSQFQETTERVNKWR